MALEALPERGALWLENWVLAATIANVTATNVNYPATRLLNPHRSDTWQTSNATSANQRVTFDLGSARLPTCFALVGTNFDSTGYAILHGADDATMTVNAVRWDFPLYQQDPVGRVLRFYPGTTPTAGTRAAKRFWSVTLDPVGFGPLNPPDDYLEIGVVWLGEYVAIRPWEGIRIRPQNPSTHSFAYGRARWSDPLPAYREGEVPLGGLTPAQWYDLESKIRAQGTKHAIVDIYASSTDPVLKRGGCMYGYFTDDPVDGSVDTPEMNELSFSFEEASG